MLPVAALGWAPGELVRLLLAHLPLPAADRVALSLLALLLSLLGAAFVSAAVIGTLTGAASVGCGPSPPSASVDAVESGLSQMGKVLRTQLLLLLLLGVALLPSLMSLALLLGAGIPALSARPEGLLYLSTLLCCLPIFSLLGLRFSLALTATAADQAGGIAALRRSALLSRGRLLDLLSFGLLWAGVVAPMLLCAVSSSLLLVPRGLCLVESGLGIALGFLFTLQGQGAAVGLALIYADACAALGLQTRLRHLARKRHYR
jgi:hypothetical protein